MAQRMALHAPIHGTAATSSSWRCRRAGLADLAVPLEVDTATGPTWFDAQKH